VRDNGGFTTIDAPGAVAYTVVFGIDESGQTVGGYVDGQGTLHGLLRDHDKFTVIDFPGARATLVARVNAQGQMVGAYSQEANAVATDLPHGFLLKDGVFTRIDVPGAVRTQPFDINNHGQIVGEYVDAQGRSHGFLLDNGVFTTIDAPDARATIATDIDDSGRIVGISGAAAGAARGFLRSPDGGFAPIAVPNGAQTYPFGINNHGQVVGRYVPVRGSVRGFLLDRGVFTDIVLPEARGDTMVLDISDGASLREPTISFAITTSSTAEPSRPSTTRIPSGPMNWAASTTVARSWAAMSMPRGRCEGSCWTRRTSPASRSRAPS
jgi:probable HAF family extracellular repeat protein